MKDDAISRQATIMALVFSEDTGGMTCGQMAKVLDVIKAVPSVQPERMRGEWVRGIGEYAKKLMECSECRRTFYYNAEWNFCPNCGADMREVDDERPD